jgi:hypothetical protein
VAPKSVKFSRDEDLNPAFNVVIRGGSANELFVARGVLYQVNLTIVSGSGNNVQISGDNAISLQEGDPTLNLAAGRDVLIAGTTHYVNNDAA